MIGEGLILTVSGMAFVFLFLLLLVGAIRITSFLLTRLGNPDKTDISLSGPAAVPGSEREIALAVALSYHKKRKNQRGGEQ